MKHATPHRAVLIALVAASLGGLTVGSARARSRSVPTFAVEPGWPKVPAQWKLGDVSSIAMDAQGNGWVLHRPRTLKPQDAAMAAPPVLEFDPAGNFIKGWGGPGSGYEWVEREHGIYVDG